VLHRIEDLDEDDFEEEQIEEMERLLQNCQDLLSELSLKLDKLQVLSNDSSPHRKQKVRRAWKRITWDQKEINEYRSRIVSNITLFNLLVGSINQYVLLTLSPVAINVHLC
jgi:chromosome segregation ATPase